MTLTGKTNCEIPHHAVLMIKPAEAIPAHWASGPERTAAVPPKYMSSKGGADPSKTPEGPGRRTSRENCAKDSIRL